MASRVVTLMVIVILMRSSQVRKSLGNVLCVRDGLAVVFAFIALLAAHMLCYAGLENQIPLSSVCTRIVLNSKYFLKFFAAPT
jgi:hypothetical protein